MRYKILLMVVLVLFTGCRTTKKLTYSKTDYDSTYVQKIAEQALTRYTETEEHVYDSVKIDYKIGKIDTLVKVRVDTFFRERYIYKQAKALAKDSTSTADSFRKSQTKATQEKTAVETVRGGTAWWKWILCISLLVAIVMIVIIRTRFFRC